MIPTIEPCPSDATKETHRPQPFDHLYKAVGETKCAQQHR